MYETEVARGMEWLDHNQPNWVNNINMENLDLAFCDECIIGQLFGEYDESSLPASLSKSMAVDLGFNRPSTEWSRDNFQVFEYLTNAWKEAILKRRAEQAIDPVDKEWSELQFQDQEAYAHV